MKKPQNGTLSVMTWNVYLGADLNPILSASLEQLPQTVTAVFRQFLATNFLKRAKTIAYQIYLKTPDIIGLQEVGLWELITPDGKTIKYNLINNLLHELSYYDLDYTVAAKNQNFKASLPDNSGNLIQYTDSDIILVRDSCEATVTQKQETNFKTNYKCNIKNDPFTILRGWSSIDASIYGQTIRIVNTHLDSISQEVNINQGNELLINPGNTKLPLIFIGSFNSNANSNKSETYATLIAAGFKDTWSSTGKGNGLTSSQDADLLNCVSILTERNDLILFKNMDHWNITNMELVGESQVDRTSEALWPSDHAGVIAELKIKTY